MTPKQPEPGKHFILLFFIASSSYAASLSEIRKQSCYPLNKNVDDLNSVGFVYKEFKKETSR